MFTGEKVGIRKSALKVFGGDLKNLYDSRRLDAGYFSKHRGMMNPVPEEGNRHPAPSPRDITGYSRWANNLCHKDYKDYRPWRPWRKRSKAAPPPVEEFDGMVEDFDTLREYLEWNRSEDGAERYDSSQDWVDEWAYELSNIWFDAYPLPEDRERGYSLDRYYSRYPEAFDPEDSPQRSEISHLWEVYPEAFEPCLNEVVCVLDGQPVYAFQLDDEADWEDYGKPDPEMLPEFIRVGSHEYELA